MPDLCEENLGKDPGAQSAWDYIRKKNEHALNFGRWPPFIEALNNLYDLDKGVRRRIVLSGLTINRHTREVMNKIALTRGYKLFPSQEVKNERGDIMPLVYTVPVWEHEAMREQHEATRFAAAAAEAAARRAAAAEPQ